MFDDEEQQEEALRDRIAKVDEVGGRKWIAKMAAS